MAGYIPLKNIQSNCKVDNLPHTHNLYSDCNLFPEYRDLNCSESAALPWNYIPLQENCSCSLNKIANNSLPVLL